MSKNARSGRAAAAIFQEINVSSAPDPLEARITELEIKLSFTDELVEGLNTTVYRQQEQIDRLAREILAIRQQIENNPPDEPSAPRDELPPHY